MVTGPAGSLAVSPASGITCCPWRLRHPTCSLPPACHRRAYSYPNLKPCHANNRLLRGLSCCLQSRPLLPRRHPPDWRLGGRAGAVREGALRRGQHAQGAIRPARPEGVWQALQQPTTSTPSGLAGPEAVSWAAAGLVQHAGADSLVQALGCMQQRLHASLVWQHARYWQQKWWAAPGSPGLCRAACREPTRGRPCGATRRHCSAKLPTAAAPPGSYLQGTSAGCSCN